MLWYGLLLITLSEAHQHVQIELSKIAILMSLDNAFTPARMPDAGWLD